MKQIVGALLGILYIGISPVAYAAEGAVMVSGRVYIKDNDQPLGAVSVSAQEAPTLVATSNSDGSYKLTLPGPGRYTLKASSEGFETSRSLVFDLKENELKTDVNFYLTPIFILEEIAVNSERSPDKTSKTVITGDELRRAPGTFGDPLRAVQSIPGVAMGSDTSSEPAIRGSGPRDNAYYVDSLPVGQLFHVDGSSIFHASLINDFNLYSGAFGPQYADVIGGVLDVSLRDPRKDRVGGKVGVSLLGANVLLEGPVNENQSFYLAARRSYFDLLLGKVSRNGVTIQLPSYSDYQGKYLWRLNNDQRLSLYVNGARDAVSFNISDTADAALSQPVLAGDSNINSSYDTQALVLDTTFSTTSYNKLAVGRTNRQFEYNIGTAGNINVDINTAYLREQFNFAPVKNHDVLLSANMLDVGVGIGLNLPKTTCTQFDPNCDLSSAPRVQLSDRLSYRPWDMSARDRWLILPQLTLIGGVRQSHDTYLDQVYTEPRLGVEWAYSDRTLFNAGWGKHNQQPAPEQTLRNYGNPYLTHILSEQSVLGVTRKYDEGWSLKSEAYYKNISDLVVNDATAIYINGGSGRAYGLEFLLKKERTENLSGWFSLTLAKSELRNDRTGETFNFSYDQPVNATLVGNYKFDGNLMLGAKWTAHTGNPYTPVIGTSGIYTDGSGRSIPVYGPIGSERLPHYHRLDVRLDRTFKTTTGKLTLFFEVINVYSQDNVSGYIYSPDYSTRKPVYQLPLLPTFGLELEF